MQEWLANFAFFGADVRDRLARACEKALEEARSDGLGSLDKPIAGSLEWIPAKVMENVPVDMIIPQNKANGCLMLWNGGQLRPVEQIMIAVIIAEMVAIIMATVPLQRDRDASEPVHEAHSGHRSVRPNKTAYDSVEPAGSAVITQVHTHINQGHWVRSSLWADACAAAIMRETLRWVPAAVSRTVLDESLIDPCDDVLQFFSCLLDAELAVLDDVRLSVSHGQEMAEDAALDASFSRNVIRIVRVLLVNVSHGGLSPESLVPRDLNLKVGSGDVSKVSVSSAQGSMGNLFDGSSGTYWQTAGSVGNHVIHVQVNEGLLLTSVSIHVDRRDGTYCPERVELSLQKRGSPSWTVLCEKSLEPRGNQFCVIADNLDSCEEYTAAKIRIVKNFENGNDSRVRGLRVSGRVHGTLGRGAGISEAVAEQVLFSAQSAMQKIGKVRRRQGPVRGPGKARTYAQTEMGVCMGGVACEGQAAGVDVNASRRETCMESELTGMEASLCEAEVLHLHLESCVRALIASSAALCLSLASDKPGVLLRLVRAARLDPALPSKNQEDASGRSGVLHGLDLAAGAKVALTGALESVRGALEALQVLGYSPAAGALSCLEMTTEQQLLMRELMDYAVMEAQEVLTCACNITEEGAEEGADEGAEECVAGSRSSSLHRTTSYGSETGIGLISAARGRTACAIFLGHLVTGLLAVFRWEDTNTAEPPCRAFLIGIFCEVIGRVLRKCTEVGIETEVAGESRSLGQDSTPQATAWPTRVEHVLRRSFVSTCIGPFLACLARVKWSSLDCGSLATLLEFGSQLVKLASRDSQCVCVLEGDVQRPAPRILCPQGHRLGLIKCNVESYCSVCDQSIPHEFKAYACMNCKYQLCCACSFLSGYHYTQLVPSSCCRPAVWIALSASAFFHAAFRGLLSGRSYSEDLSTPLSSGLSTSDSLIEDLGNAGDGNVATWGDKSMHSGGFRATCWRQELERSCVEGTRHLSGRDLMKRMKRTREAEKSELTEVFEILQGPSDESDALSEAVKYVFQAVLKHSRLSIAPVISLAELPPAYVTLYEMAALVVVLYQKETALMARKAKRELVEPPVSGNTLQSSALDRKSYAADLERRSSLDDPRSTGTEGKLGSLVERALESLVERARFLLESADAVTGLAAFNLTPDSAGTTWPGTRCDAVGTDGCMLKQVQPSGASADSGDRPKETDKAQSCLALGHWPRLPACGRCSSCERRMRGARAVGPVCVRGALVRDRCASDLAGPQDLPATSQAALQGTDGAPDDAMDVDKPGQESANRLDEDATDRLNVLPKCLSVADAVFKFVCDRDLRCADVRAALKAAAEHEQATRVVTGLVRLLDEAPAGLQDSLRLDPSMLGCLALWRDVGAAASLRFDRQGSLWKVQHDTLMQHVVAGLESQDEFVALSCVAALSHIASQGNLDQIHALASSAAWDGLLRLCDARLHPHRPYAFCSSPGLVLGPGRGSRLNGTVPAALVVHSASANLQSADNVLRTEDLSSYWQSDVGSGTPPQRWIMLQLRPAGALQQVTLQCADAMDMSSNYAPRSVVVEAGASLETLREVATAVIPPGTNGPLPLLPESVQDALRAALCHLVKLRVECGGRNCRLRGLSVDVAQPTQVMTRLPVTAVISRAVAACAVLASCGGGTALDTKTGQAGGGTRGGQAVGEALDRGTRGGGASTQMDGCGERAAAEAMSCSGGSGAAPSEDHGGQSRAVRVPSQLDLLPERAEGRVFSGVLGMLERPGPARDWSMAALGMGLAASCLAGPRRAVVLEHAVPLLRRLLVMLADSTAPQHVLAQAAALVATVAGAAGRNAGDAAAEKAAELTEMRAGGGQSGPAGSGMARFLIACLEEHGGAANSSALVRQNVADALLSLSRCPGWLQALTHVYCSMLVPFPPPLGTVRCGAGVAAPLMDGHTRDAAAEAALYAALSAAGGSAPVLMCGSAAELRSGTVRSGAAVRVVAYAPGDAEAAVALASGMVEWAAATDLEAVVTARPVLDGAGLETAVGALGHVLRGVGHVRTASCVEVLRLETAAQALRCVAQHAQRDAAATVAALDSAGLLPGLLAEAETAAAAGYCGPLKPMQAEAEERAAACVAAALGAAHGPTSAAAKLLPLVAAAVSTAGGLASEPASGEDRIRAADASLGCRALDRRRVWGSAATAAWAGGVDAALAELLAAHAQLRHMYALMAVVHMLPELVGRGYAAGRAGYRLSVAAALGGHPAAQVAAVVRRLVLEAAAGTRHGGDSTRRARGVVGDVVGGGMLGDQWRLNSGGVVGDRRLVAQAGVDTGPCCRGRDGAEGEESGEGGGLGGDGAGMYGLLRCVVEDMCSGEALETRPRLPAQQWLEAAEVQAGPGRPFRAGMEFPGQTEVGVRCDGVASQEVVKLYYVASGDSAGSDVDDSEGEGRDSAQRLVELETPLPAGPAWLVTAPGAAVHVLVDGGSAAVVRRATRVVATSGASCCAVAESEHAYRPGVSYRGAILLPGSAEVAVAFDPRCSTGGSGDTLVFYSGPDFRADAFSAAHHFSGSIWTGFRVPGPAVYYWFKSGQPGTGTGSGRGWGYRFTASAPPSAPLSRRAEARLAVAAAALSAALSDARLARAVSRRGTLEALARACASAAGDTRRQLAGCLARAVGVAGDEAGCVDDGAVTGVAEQLVRLYDERAAAGEETGTEDGLGWSLLMSAW
jgi:hypothetical protein